MYFYAARNTVAQALQAAAGDLPAPGGGTRPRVLIAHPMGVPGRPLVIRTTTVMVDDVWMITGTSSLSRRGLTFDGANDVVLADWALDRSAGSAIRAHRKALMGAHLGTGPGVAGTPGGAPASAVGAPEAAFVELIQGGESLYPVDLGLLKTIEVDTKEDLEEARRLFANSPTSLSNSPTS